MNSRLINRELSGWGRFPRVLAELVEPSQPETIESTLSNSQQVVAHAMGRSYGDASLPIEGGVAVGTRWLDRFVAFDAESGVLTAESGVTLEQIVDVCLPHGWFLPVTPGTRFVSLGGAIASNVHGKNHHHHGAFVKCIISLDLLTESGVVTCSPSLNAPIFFATVGGYGLTGIILRATIQLRRVSSSAISARLVKVSCLNEAIDTDLAADTDYEYSVTWLDALADAAHLGRGIVMLGNHAEADMLPPARRSNPLAYQWNRSIRAPSVFPGWLLNPASNKLFNFAYGNRFLGKYVEGLVGLESWFYPLDRVLDWNRFYGRHGFAEFQCSLPQSSAREGMKVLLSRIRKAGLGSFLAVYKRVGHDAVTMPFAIPGFTLALDLGLRSPAVLHLMDELDRIVLDHAGRIYLSKDARMSAKTFHAMYPEYNQWKAVASQVSPTSKFRSRLAQRLEI